MNNPRIIERVLMCRDHEAAIIRYNPLERRVTGKLVIIDPAYLPIGCLEPNGICSKPAISRWLARRAIPDTRPGINAAISDLKISDPIELMVATMGLSLSDQYWLRPYDFEGSWKDVSCFGRPFSPALGQAIVARGSSDSIAEPPFKQGLKALVGTSSPDAALNGNLPKRWTRMGDIPALLKLGRKAHYQVEPYNESLASRVCGRLLAIGDYIPYTLVPADGLMHYSCCPCMVDDKTELVPALDIFRSEKRGGALSRYEAFARICEAHGIADIRTALSKMIAVDHIIGNTDRHWGNFGVLIDTESRTWLRAAPLFDNGESFRAQNIEGTAAIKMKSIHPMPFRTDIHSQLDAFAEDLSWFDPERLEGFEEDAVEILRKNPFVDKIFPEHIDRVITDVATNVREVAERSRALKE